MANDSVTYHLWQGLLTKRGTKKTTSYQFITGDFVKNTPLAVSTLRKKRCEWHKISCTPLSQIIYTKLPLPHVVLVVYNRRRNRFLLVDKFFNSSCWSHSDHYLRDRTQTFLLSKNLVLWHLIFFCPEDRRIKAKPCEKKRCSITWHWTTVFLKSLSVEFICCEVLF